MAHKWFDVKVLSKNKTRCKAELGMNKRDMSYKSCSGDHLPILTPRNLPQGTGGVTKSVRGFIQIA
jgi:hypothetical protein